MVGSNPRLLPMHWWLSIYTCVCVFFGGNEAYYFLHQAHVQLMYYTCLSLSLRWAIRTQDTAPEGRWKSKTWREHGSGDLDPRRSDGLNTSDSLLDLLNYIQMGIFYVLKLRTRGVCLKTLKDITYRLDISHTESIHDVNVANQKHHTPCRTPHRKRYTKDVGYLIDVPGM